MPSIMENFASCLVAEPEDKKEKESFGNMK